MNAKNVSLACSAGIIGLVTVAAVTVASVEVLTGQSINPLAASYLSSAVVAAAGTLGYHLGTNGNGASNGKSSTL